MNHSKTMDPPEIVRAIMSLYNQPTFFVSMGGQHSTTLPQATRIRQGCPLSPYLFLAAMTTMYADIHDALGGPASKASMLLAQIRTETSYADDTICVARQLRPFERLL